MRVGFVGIDAVLFNGFGHLRHLDAAFIGQTAQCSQHHEMAVDLEMLTQLVAEVGTAVTVGTQYAVLTPLGNELANLVGERLDVVGGRHDGAAGGFEQPGDVRHLLLFLRMQQVVTLAIEPFAPQLGETGRAPDVGRNTPVLLEQLGRLDDFAQNGARTQKLNAILALATFLQAIHAPDDAFLVAFAQAGMAVVLVHYRNVVINVFLVLHHATQAIVNDDGKLVREGRVVRNAVGNQARHDVAMAVLVLQPFTVQCGAARRTTQQEAACLHDAGSPGEVAHPLEPEHRVIDEERDHDAVVRGVRRGRRDPGAERTRLVDAFLQKLTVFGFPVVHDLVFVDRYVLLPFGRINADLTEQAFHAERARFVGQNGYDARPQLLVAQDLIENAHECLRGGDLAPLGRGFEHGLEHFETRYRQRFVGLGATLGQVPAQRLATLVQVFHLGRIVGRTKIRQFFEFVVGDGNVEPVAELAHRSHVELLLLVRGVLGLADVTHAVTLDGFGKNDGRLAGMVGGGVEGGIDLVGIVAATVQAPDVFVAHAADHFEQLRMLAEEVLANVGAVVRLVGLVFAVDRFFHDAAQDAFLVALQKRIPVAAPN